MLVHPLRHLLFCITCIVCPTLWRNDDGRLQSTFTDTAFVGWPSRQTTPSCWSYFWKTANTTVTSTTTTPERVRVIRSAPRTYLINHPKNGICFTSPIYTFNQKMSARCVCFIRICTNVPNVRYCARNKVISTNPCL